MIQPLIEEVDLGTIYGTCGHELSIERDAVSGVAVKGYMREGDRCIDFRSLCADCEADYEKDGMVLHNKEEENKWLREGK